MSGCTGTLYNKDSILEFLLPSEDEVLKAESAKRLAGTVTSLRDVVEIKFEADPADSDQWICPITNKPLGPKTKAVYLVPCGHAFSAAAIKEVSGDKCLQCNEPYEQSNVIPILPIAEEDLKALEARFATLKEKGLTHSLKKAAGSKKRKKNREVTQSLKAQQVAPAASIKNSSTASLTARVLEEQEDRNKKRKLQKNDNLDTLFSTKGKNGMAEKKNDFFTRGFSIPGKKP